MFQQQQKGINKLVKTIKAIILRKQQAKVGKEKKRQQEKIISFCHLNIMSAIKVLW